MLPDREKMKTQMEALIYHFKIVTEGFTVPEGEVYMPIESPRGEMGYYVVSDGTAKPYRVHMRSPSFANLQTLKPMCEGRLIADVVAAIGSIDIVLGDCRSRSSSVTRFRRSSISSVSGLLRLNALDQSLQGRIGNSCASSAIVFCEPNS